MSAAVNEKQATPLSGPGAARVRLSDSDASNWSQLLLQFKEEEKNRARRASIRRKFEKTLRGRILAKIAD